MNKQQKIAQIGALVLTCLNFDRPAWSEEAPKISDRTLAITTGYFYRRRTDDNLKEPRWPSEEMKSNVINTVFDLSSGYLGGLIKTDLAWIGALNFQKDYRCSEVAFCSKSTDQVLGEPQIWAHNDLDGVALQKASVTLSSEILSAQWKIRAGIDQFNAGVLGTNWGFLFPGSYRGIQLESKWGDLALKYVWTDAYRTPWATELGHFFAADGSRIKEIESAGIAYSLPEGFFAEIAGGRSSGWQKRHFAKFGWQGKAFDADLKANYQYYRYTIVGKDFAAQENTFGKQNVVSLQLTTANSINLSAEYVGTQVSSWFSVAEFIPRMSSGYGNSQGRLDYWWNAVSDFNKDGEQAFNLGLRSPAIKIGALSATTGANLMTASNISGWDTNRQRTDRAGYERGYNADFGVSYPEGLWKPLAASLHYTHLEAGGTDLDATNPASLFSRYGLYSTNDLKIMLTYAQAFSG